MTYSIVARDPASGRIGVAVQSHFFSTGSVVPWAEAGVGGVATQASAEVSYGPRGLELLRAGRSAPDALRELVAADAGAPHRQVAIVDARGRAAAHTGEACIECAGHRTADDVSVQANMMERDTVPDAMLGAFRSTRGELVARLLAALDAAEAEGGDIRGRRSAAILVVSGTSTGPPWADRQIDLRVEDHREPLVELRRLVDVHRAYELLGRADAAVRAGDTKAAEAHVLEALERAPGNTEILFWAAMGAAAGGRIDAAKALLAQASSENPRWVELARRLSRTREFALGDEARAALLGS